MNQIRPIYKVCKNDEVITMEALSDTVYEKCYFDSYTIGEPLQNPRKVKTVDVTTTTKCKSVLEYFNQCVKTDGYIFM